MMEKNLRLIENKCDVITIGTKNKERKQRFSWKQMQLCVENLRWNNLRKKWLGQQISAGGLAESVAETVAAKEGKIKAACIEVANIVNDWRTEIVGGLDADGEIKRKNEEWLISWEKKQKANENVKKSWERHLEKRTTSPKTKLEKSETYSKLELEWVNSRIISQKTKDSWGQIDFVDERLSPSGTGCLPQGGAVFPIEVSHSVCQ